MKGNLLIVLCVLGIWSTSFAQYKKIVRLTRRGEFEKVLAYTDEKLGSINDKRINQLRLQQIHVALAKVHYLLGDYARAELEFQTALEIVNKKAASGRRLRLTDFDVMDEAAQFYVNTGNFRQAKSLIAQSLTKRVRKFRKRDPTNYRPYLALGLLHFYNNRLDSARHFLETYQDQIRNSNYTGFLDINKYADTYQVLAEIEVRDHHWRKAKKFAKKSARLQRHPWTKRQVGKNYFARIRALNSASIAFHYTDKHRKAIAYNRKALALYNRKYKSQEFVLVPLYLQKARLSAQRNQVDSCLLQIRKVLVLQRQFILESFNHLSEYEKENLSARLNEGFQSACEIVLGLDDHHRLSDDNAIWSDLFNYVLHTKGLILRETNRLIEQMRTSSDLAVRADFAQWKSWKNELAYLSARAKPKQASYAESLQNKIVQLEKTLRIDSVSTDPHVDWKAVASKLSGSESAVEMLRVVNPSVEGKVTYIAFVLTGKQNPLQIVKIPAGHDLDQRMIRYYFNTTTHQVDDTLSFMRFWHPIHERVKESKRVYFSADGVYHLLNLSTLQDPHTRRFLADELAVVNVTGLKNLVIDRPKAFSFTTAALFGSPDFTTLPDSTVRIVAGAEALSALPGTLAEVEQINSLFQKRSIKSSVFTKKKATEHALATLPSSNILHVATHGFFTTNSFSRDPMLGAGLILSTDTAQFSDGLLTAYEASALNLEETDLVVLSACKTGLGEIRESEGVYGLQRAFEVAGVDFLLMTLWNVDDAVTKEFMVDFYQRLLNEKNISTAFDKAQHELKRKYPPVFYWGAYKLISSF